MSRLYFVLLTGFCCSVFVVSGAHSATINVDAAGGADASSVAEAVAMAQSNSEADEIIIAPGIYSVDSIEGETLVFSGSDDIVLRGSDPNDRPVIVVEPNFAEAIDDGDGVKITMSGALTFENLVFVPSENFTFLPDVDDLFAVVNNSDRGISEPLDLTFRNVVITHSDLEFNPTTLTGFDDPRNADNVLRDDAINIESLGEPAPEVNVLLDGVIITAFGTEGTSDAVVLDGPNVHLTVEGGSIFSFITRRGIFAFNAGSVTINGTDDEPVLIYGAGETLIRASSGVHEWNHLWCVGLNEDGGTVTGFAARIDPNSGATVVANDCIFSTAINDGVFMNFGSDVPLSYEFNRCTFHNVPEMIRFGFVGEPGPQDNISVTATDCIVENFFWTAPNDGTFFSPEPNVVHYGDGDNTLAQLTINNMAYNTISFVSSTSGAREPVTAGNIISDAEFMFATEAFSTDTMDSFLVATNCDLLGNQATGGAPLVGARTSPCGTGIHEWSVH